MTFGAIAAVIGGTSVIVTIALAPFLTSGVAAAQYNIIQGKNRFLTKVIEAGLKYYWRSFAILGLWVIIVSLLFFVFSCCFQSFFLNVYFPPSDLIGKTDISDLRQRMFLPSLITGLAGTAFSVPIGMWLISSFGALVTDKRDTLRSFVIIFEYMRKTKNGLGILSITFVVSYIILAVGSVIGQLTLLLPQGIIFYVSLVSNIIQTLVSPALYLLAIAFFTALAYEYFIKGESEDGISE